MSDTPHYAFSQDYELMFVLLEKGPLLGFVDYKHGSTLRDPVQIKRVADGNDFEYRAGVRGFGYINAFSKDAKDKFVEKCRLHNLSFIVANADAEASLNFAHNVLQAAQDCVGHGDPTSDVNLFLDCDEFDKKLLIDIAELHARAEHAEGEVARLSKMVDWLASKLAEHCTAEDGDCNIGRCPRASYVVCGDITPTFWKEAARRSVADSNSD